MREISRSFIEETVAAIRANKPVRKRLPGGGRIHIDRQLPFLCLYRRPPGREDVGTERLVQSEASYLAATGGEEVSQLVRAVASALAEIFGRSLVLELWAMPRDRLPEETGAPRPRFRLLSMDPPSILPTIETLETSLQKVTLHRLSAEVEIVKSEEVAPPSLPPVLEPEEASASRAYLLGLEVAPLYRDASGGTLHPYELAALRKGISLALKKGFFRFARETTTFCPTHYAMMGRRLVTKAVFEADAAMAEIEDRFDFLLQVTPVNSEEAWRDFEKEGFRGSPHFHYRPRPFDVAEMKRRLFDVRLERIEDPTLYEIFSQKLVEIDRKLTMLMDRDTPNFLYGSLPTYGGVEPELLALAERILSLLPPSGEGTRGAEETVDAETFARAAEREIAYYRHFYPPMESRVEIRDDIVAGAMVSGGNFLIARSARFPRGRVEALLHHEIGTHVLTYTNALVQPFRQLHTGLSGYEEMQEGIAVLAEYLSGGISRGRLRILAARVVGADALCRGKSFEETFHLLHEKYGFDARSAFVVTTRLYRGGGLTKDAIYLRGLVRIFDYLHGGGPLEPLFVGKIAAEHIPLIEELRYREVLQKPPLWPRWLELPEAQRRLSEIREEKLSLLDLIEKGYL